MSECKRIYSDDRLQILFPKISIFIIIKLNQLNLQLPPIIISLIKISNIKFNMKVKPPTASKQKKVEPTERKKNPMK